MNYTGLIKYTYKEENYTIDIEVSDISKNFSSWIDLENPESIRVRFSNIVDSSQIMTDYAKNLRKSLDHAHMAVENHINDSTHWKTVFN